MTTKRQLEASLEMQKLIDTHRYDCLPDIDQLLWEGHDQRVPDIILVDLDHTVCHSHWRDKMIGNVPWDEYHRWHIHDRPVPEVAALLQTLSKSEEWTLIGMSGRNETFRATTIKWLHDHAIPLDAIYLREAGDYRPNHVMKIERCIELFGRPLSDRIAFVLDDNEKIVSVFAEEGVTTLTINVRSPVERKKYEHEQGAEDHR